MQFCSMITNGNVLGVSDDNFITNADTVTCFDAVENFDAESDGNEVHDDDSVTHANRAAVGVAIFESAQILSDMQYLRAIRSLTLVQY